jgi:3-oxoacyl-[acyl-carrier protein] reductase
MDLGLRGRVVVITGSSRGIGRATAVAFGAEGARVVLSARGAEQLEEAAGAVRAAGGEALPVQVDVTTEEGVGRLLSEATRAFGPVDVLVNNVGGSRGAPTWEASDAEWREVLDLNLMPAVRCSRAVIPSMVERRAGAIVIVSSIYGRESGGPATYNAAKAAELSLAKQLAKQLAPHNVRVNAVAPGSVIFPGGSWQRRVDADPEAMKRFVAAEMPLGRFGAPEEIASAIVFLGSARASLITGACLNVDGCQSRSNI